MQVIFFWNCCLAGYAGEILFWKCRLADYAGEILFWNCRLSDYVSKIHFSSFPNSFLCPPPIHKFILFFFYASERETEALVSHFGWSFWLVKGAFWLVDAPFG